MSASGRSKLGALIDGLRVRASEMEAAGVIDLSATGAEPHEYLALCDEVERLDRIAGEAMMLLNHALKGDLNQDTRMAVIGFLSNHGSYHH